MSDMTETADLLLLRMIKDDPIYMTRLERAFKPIRWYRWYRWIC